VGSGALVFTVSAIVLWAIARGYGKNFGAAWNTLIGAGSGTGSPVFAPGGSTGPFGGSSGGWGSNTSFAPPVPYNGVPIAA
jgi:hypothetical protein